MNVIVVSGRASGLSQHLLGALHDLWVFPPRLGVPKEQAADGARHEGVLHRRLLTRQKRPYEPPSPRDIQARITPPGGLALAASIEAEEAVSHQGDAALVDSKEEHIDVATGPVRDVSFDVAAPCDAAVTEHERVTARDGCGHDPRCSPDKRGQL